MPKMNREDLLSGFFVFLIALPLCMGIALASGFPAITGIISAVVGSLISSFCGSSRLTIKGPAAGLIVIAAAAVHELGDGDLFLGYKRCLAVGVISAIIQIIFSIKKLGRFAELMPPSIVHGMLSAIGVIIVSKQIHILFGVTPHGEKSIDLLAEIPFSISHLNPEVFFIGGLALLLLILLPRLNIAWIKKIPAPLFVLFLAVPLSLYFDFDHWHEYFFLGKKYSIGPNYLVELPSSLISAISFPDFSDIFSISSFKFIIMFSLVGTVESLLTVSAVNSLDPESKPSDLNKDLFSVGVGNLISSFLGGLPMISEIVRSKANIDNGAKTYWANFYHGIFLLIFVLFFPKILHLIPFAVLSAMLVFTGLRLASPSEFIHSYKMGKDQFFLFATTFTVTLFSDLLIGVIVGIILKIILHSTRGASISKMFSLPLTIATDGNMTQIKVNGPCLFTNFLMLKNVIDLHSTGNKSVHINFQNSSLVDLTAQKKLKEIQSLLGAKRLRISGMHNHKPTSKYNDSTKILA